MARNLQGILSRGKMKEISAYNIKVTGDVQGVFYRHNAQKVAKEFKLTGYTANKQDGSVLTFVQGDINNVKEFINWCHSGSPMATVENVEIESVEPNESIKKFEIK